MDNLLLSSLSLAATDSLDPAIMSSAIYLATTNRPYLNAICFLAGIFLITFAGAFVLFFGGMRQIDSWFVHPGIFVVVCQIIVGAALIYAGQLSWRRKPKIEDGEVQPLVKITPLSSFIIGGIFSLVDVPTNVPLLAVSELLTKAGSTFVTSVVCNLSYCAVKVAPPLLVVLSLAYTNSKILMTKIKNVQRPLIIWWPKVTAVVIVFLGAILIIDGFSCFMTGQALIPL